MCPLIKEEVKLKSRKRLIKKKRDIGKKRDFRKKEEKSIFDFLIKSFIYSKYICI